ncbi:MAG: thioredoxin family protein [Muribaculaceae bacterium]|nr:thioredoxin family protein [Muribaculaceae bacterium]
MKKAIVSALIAMAGIMPAAAQTEFRHITFDEAKTAAKAEGKLIFVDFYTQWCGPCKRMAANVFPKKEIGDYLNPNFVCLKLDAEAEGAELAKTMDVKAYPTFMVFDAEGKKLGSFAGMKDGQEFFTAVEICKNPDLSPERVTARYEAGERTPEVVRAYAINIVDNARDYMAAFYKAGKIIDDYYDSLTEQQRLNPENHFLFDTYTTGYNTPRVQFMIANRDRFDASKSNDIAEQIKRQMTYEATRYFTTNSITDEASRQEYDKFKQTAGLVGLSSKFANMFRFAEAHASMDVETYVDFCDKNFATLGSEEQGALLSQLSKSFEPSTPEQVKKVSGFARKQLPNLTTDQLLMTAYSIHDLEAPKH